jgi:hypothetical protein
MESYDSYMAKLAIAMIAALTFKSIKQPIQKIKIARYGVC